MTQVSNGTFYCSPRLSSGNAQARFLSVVEGSEIAIFMKFSIYESHK